MNTLKYIVTAAGISAAVLLNTKNQTIGLNQTASLIDTKKEINTLSTPTDMFYTGRLRGSSFYSGDRLNITLPNSTVVVGTINITQEQVDGTVRIGGSFKDGTFAYAIKNNVVSGVIISGSTVYELLETKINAHISYVNRKIDTVVCHEHPGDDITPVGAAVSVGTITTGTINTGTINTGTFLSSKPFANTHLYLEFNGAVVQDPLYNAGKTINAISPEYTLNQIKEIWSIVAERYSAFNVNITTDVKFYNATKPGLRMRAIFTKTNAWCPGHGGIAFIGSMKYSGTNIYSSNIPCFVFTNMLGNIKNVAECAAHELGHTLGLSHDGTPSSAYYYGQGNWAPIMGCAYGKSIVQFSKGEYTNANQKQDDLSMIVATNKNIPYAMKPSAIPVPLNADSINEKTVISNQADYRLYSISTTSPGTLSLTVSPGTYSAADVGVEIVNVITGKSAIVSESLNSQKTELRVTLETGMYTIKVYGAGEGNTLTTGYTKYGSIGTIVITGSFKVK